MRSFAAFVGQHWKNTLPTWLKSSIAKTKTMIKRLCLSTQFNYRGFLIELQQKSSCNGLVGY